MRKISEKRLKGHMQGRGNYGMSITYKGHRGLGNKTWKTKQNAERYLSAFKKAQEDGRYTKYKNPRLVKVK